MSNWIWPNTINVIANSEEEATKMALEHAGDVYYSEHTSEYEVQGVTCEEKKDDILQKVILESGQQLLKSMREQWDKIFGSDNEEHYHLTKLLEEMETRRNKLQE